MSDKKDIRLNSEQKDELAHVLKTIDNKGTGYISLKSLGDAFSAVGIKVPPYEIRKMAAELERLAVKGIKQRTTPHRTSGGTATPAYTNGDHHLSPWDDEDPRINFYEFEKLYKDLKSKEFAASFKSMVSRKDNLVTHGGMSETSSEGTTHTIRQEEQVAFSHWINTNLGHDKDLKYLLPIDSDGSQLYDKVKDGILLCKIINFSCPDTIDERALNKKNLNLYTMHENLVLDINSALAIGCNVVNIGADDLSKGKPHLVLGLLWQIIRIGLFNQVDLHHCPGLIKLLGEGERLEDMMKLSTEAILLRWVNYHLRNAGFDRVITNFTNDIMDSLAYVYLIHEIAPKDKAVGLHPLREPDLERRAELMLKEADKIKCRAFVSPRDVVSGNPKLNVAFVANMFNTHPALLLEDAAEKVKEIEQDEGIVEETREEKTYRNWMNSMGVSPYVNWLYSDLTDGLVILQLYDYITPGIVEWLKVHKRFSKLKAFMEKIENCNYAIHLGKRMRFSLVGIAGQDINEGNQTLTLALVWQLMRAYTLSLLRNLTSNHASSPLITPTKPITEKEIIEWVNRRLKTNNKTSKISSFQDSSISDARVIIDLIDTIKHGCIDYTQVKDGSLSDQAKLDNAKYAISMSRKLGAKIYALPDDIVEVKPKMVMTVFACLMGRDYNNFAAGGNTPAANHVSITPPFQTQQHRNITPDNGETVLNVITVANSPSPVPIIKQNNNNNTKSIARGSPCTPTTLKSSPVKGPNQNVIFSSSTSSTPDSSSPRGARGGSESQQKFQTPSPCLLSPSRYATTVAQQRNSITPTISPTSPTQQFNLSKGPPLTTTTRDLDAVNSPLLPTIETLIPTPQDGGHFDTSAREVYNNTLVNEDSQDREAYLRYADHMNGSLSPDSRSPPIGQRVVSSINEEPAENSPRHVTKFNSTTTSSSAAPSPANSSPVKMNNSSSPLKKNLKNNSTSPFANKTDNNDLVKAEEHLRSWIRRTNNDHNSDDEENDEGGEPHMIMTRVNQVNGGAAGGSTSSAIELSDLDEPPDDDDDEIIRDYSPPPLLIPGNNHKSGQTTTKMNNGILKNVVAPANHLITSPTQQLLHSPQAASLAAACNGHLK